MDGKYRKLMIVFEGPDMCGKSTQLDMAYDRLKEEGVSVAKWKFPNYLGKHGQDILHHLTHFNIKEVGADKAEHELRINSIHMMENKLWDSSTILNGNPSSKANIILCDRFTASQLVYDLAWIPLLRKKRLLPFGNKKHFCELAKNVLHHVHEVITEFAKYFDVEFIYYNQSKFIRDHINLVSPDRRIDEYDANTGYQRIVADLFSTLELQLNTGDMGYSAVRETLRTYHPQIREAVYFGDSLIRDIMEDISRDPAYAYKYMITITELAPKGFCRVIDPDMGFVIQNIGSVMNNMPENDKSYEARIENSKKYTHMSTMRAIADILAARTTDGLSDFEKDFNFVLCKSLVNKQSYGIPDAMKGE